MVRKVDFILIALFFGSFSAFSQNDVIDSLSRLFIQSKEDTVLVKIHNNLAVAYINISSFEKAKEELNCAVKIIEKFDLATTVRDKSWLSKMNSAASTLNNFGMIYLYTGEYNSALEKFSDALVIYQEIESKTGIGFASSNIGACYYYQGNNADASTYFLKALLIYKELLDQSKMLVLYNNLGNIYFSEGNYAESLKNYSDALKLAENSENSRQRIADLLSNIANIYREQGLFEGAFENYISCLEICKETNHSMGAVHAYAGIGQINFERGNPSQAMEDYHLGLTLAKEIGYPYGTAGILTNIGVVNLFEGNFKEALINHEEALIIFENIGMKAGVAESYKNIGDIYFEQKKYNDAIENYTTSFQIYTQIGEKLGVSKTLNGISLSKLKKGLDEDISDAILMSHNSQELALEIGALNQVKDATRNLILGYCLSQQIDSAVAQLSTLQGVLIKELGVNYFSLSEREKELYFTTMESDFGLYYDLTLRSGQYLYALSDTAYNLALQNKGLTLKSATNMRNAINRSGDTLLISEYHKWLQLKEQISVRYSTGLNTTEMEYQASKIEEELIKKSTVFNDHDKIKNLDWKQVRERLNEGESAIEFVHFRSEIDTTNSIIYAAFIVTHKSTHPDIIKLCSEEDLEEILGTYQGNNLSFVNKVYGTLEDGQTALYQKIWKPLEPFLKDMKTVYYSPSGLLHKISFASISKSQNVFLSDLYNFRQMSSTGKVAMPDEVVFNEHEKFFLMGGVNYNSEKTSKEIWSYLPGSLNETDVINSYLQKKKYSVNYLNSTNANETNFKEKIAGSSIVHIATHGFFFPNPEKVREEMKADTESNQDLKFRGSTNYANWSFVNNKNPLMRSGIVLAGANDVWERDALAEGEDGILTAQEVSNLDLRNTKLVVLSACETGLGDIKGSEGVFGLQRAFKMAGVKYLIMSLWQVPDKETSEFMQLFYKNLLKIKDIPTAFQKTQKVMREKYDPYYWGAFVLIE